MTASYIHIPNRMTSNPFILNVPPPPPTASSSSTPTSSSSSPSRAFAKRPPAITNEKKMANTSTSTTTFQIAKPPFPHSATHDSPTSSSNYSFSMGLNSNLTPNSTNESTFTYSPLSIPTSIDLMNYSPKHSRKPSSLSSSRNINMKNLSLNLSQDEDANGSAPPSNINDPSLFNKPTIIRRKTLTLSIPSDHEAPSSQELPLMTPTVTSTPVFPPDLNLRLRSNTTPNLSNPANFRFPPLPNDSIDFNLSTSKPPEISSSASNLQSPFIINNDQSLVNQLNSVSIGDSPRTIKLGLVKNDSKRTSKSLFSSVDSQTRVSIHESSLSQPHSQTFTTPVIKPFPEELQEKSQLDAYPSGPANVLNGSIFLYSDPSVDGYKININDFDLVINVAKECKNLSSQFVTNDKKEYIYIPWSHTSSISKELPILTEKIRQYDDSSINITNKRKILIHCQCGVSRSACVIVAYFMKKFNINVNEAYELLKLGTDSNETMNKSIKSDGYHVDACDRICPNMSLIFELMEFGESLSK